MIEPHFERRIIDHSYACRTGKGTHRALQQFVTWARTTRYVLKMDVHRYFSTIDYSLFKDRLRHVLKDSSVLALCDAIIDGSNEQEPVIHYFLGGDLLTPVERRRGIPIGNLTSQFFGNVYLDALDHFVKERLRVRKHLRYVDDFCCGGDNKEALRETRAEIVDFLAGSLRLRPNERKSRLRQVREGIEFLGFVVFPEQIRLNQTAIRRHRRRVRELRRGYAGGIFPHPTPLLDCSHGMRMPRKELRRGCGEM